MTEHAESKQRAQALAGLLREGRLSAVIAVRGDSMLPTLRSERRVEVRFGDTHARFGDLVVFRQADYFAVHRCVGHGEADGKIHLRTRGDGRTDCDSPVNLSDVLGIVTSLERSEGWRATRGPLARLYAVLAAAHGCFWAEAGALASRVDGWIGRRALRGAVETADRLSLRLADTMFFRAMHRQAPEPAGEAKGLETRCYTDAAPGPRRERNQ